MALWSFSTIPTACRRRLEKLVLPSIFDTRHIPVLLSPDAIAESFRPCRPNPTYCRQVVCAPDRVIIGKSLVVRTVTWRQDEDDDDDLDSDSFGPKLHEVSRP